jgi:hypothetical protein
MFEHLHPGLWVLSVSHPRSKEALLILNMDSRGEGSLMFFVCVLMLVSVDAYLLALHRFMDGYSSF